MQGFKNIFLPNLVPLYMEIQSSYNNAFFHLSCRNEAVV